MLRQLSLPLPHLPAIEWKRWKWILIPLAVFLITRLVIFGSAYLSEVALPSDPNHWHPHPDNLFLDIWARWDSKWYVNIVNNGYWFQLGQESNVAFFPLYPLLMAVVMPLAGQDAVLSGIVVSNLCLFLALIYLYQLALLEFGDEAIAFRTIYYLAAFPTAFYFSAVYTESTFLLFSVATVYYARQQAWGWAALMGLLASASRIVGVLVAMLVGLEWLRAHGWTLRDIHRRQTWLNLLVALRQDWGNLLLIGLIPLGLLSYMAFLFLSFKDPIAFSTVQAAWYRQNIGPIAVLQRDLSTLFSQNFATGEIWWKVILDVSAFALAMALVPVIWRRLGTSYALLIILGMVIPSMSATQSLSRYIVVLFPVFLILGSWGRFPLIDRFLTVTFTLLLGICTAIFVNWVFIA